MLRPAYQVTLDATVFSAATLGPLISLEVRRAKNGPADELVARIGRDTRLQFTEGAPATAELGWDGATEFVFTGAIASVESRVGGFEITALGEQNKLMRARGDRAFIAQNAGQVVSALASAAAVATETIDDGMDLPVYFADSARSAYQHCMELARRCGFDLYTTGEGKLVFSAFRGGAAGHTLRYGERIASVSVERNAFLDQAAFVPESPSSSSGDDTASWFVKDSSAHQALASRGAGVLVADPVLRTKQAAETALLAWQNAQQRDAVSATVALAGSADIHPGQSVALEQVPDPGIDGVYQVMSVTHQLSRRTGFRTVLSLGGIP